MKVGDLVRSLHALDSAELGVILEISEPQLTNPNACPYKIHWFVVNGDINRHPTLVSWNRDSWLEVVNENR